MVEKVEDNVILLAATYKWVPEQTLSRLYVDSERAYFILSRFPERFIFQTCHRVEFYFYVPDSNLDVQSVLQEIYGTQDVVKHFRLFRGVEAIRHIMRVAAGLESAIVGECEVLGQLERAFTHAVRNRHVTHILKCVIEQAIRFGKYVRTVTGISRGITGYGSLTVHYLKKLFGDLSTTSILIVGVGEMGSTLAKELHDAGARNVILLNRTVDKAREVAQKYNFKYDALTRGNLLRYIEQVDVAIFVASVQEPLLKEEDLKGVKKRPLIIDLGMPRNVDPRVDTAIITLEDLAKLAEKHNREKVEEVRKVEKMLDEELNKVLKLVRLRHAQKMFGMYMKFTEEIAEREVERALSEKIIPEAIADKVKLIVRSTLSKALRPVIKAIQEEIDTNPESVYSVLTSILRCMKEEFKFEKSVSDR